MKIPFLIGLTGILGAVVASQSGSADSVLETHTKQLQTAKALSAVFTVQNLPGGPLDYKLKFSRPAKFRLDTPDEVVVGDGVTVWSYKKSDNSYTQLPQTDADIKKLLKRDSVLAWAGFFAKEPFKDDTSAKVGSKLVMKGNPVTSVSVTIPGTPDREATYFIDQNLGFARGVSINAGPNKDTIVLAKELTVSSTPGRDADFEFTIPAGAKKIDPNARSAGTTFEKVNSIFQTNCAACHNSGRPRSGLDLTTYAGAIAGGRTGKDVIPGDPDNSPMMLYLKASGKPQMPPSGAMSDSDIAMIASWIKDGAKEK